jgi:hypothetical protein
VKTKLLISQRTVRTRLSETCIGDASKEVGLEINLEKPKHMFMLLIHHQNIGQNRDVKIAKTDRLKMCHSSNIYGRQQQIKI